MAEDKKSPVNNGSTDSSEAVAVAKVEAEATPAKSSTESSSEQAKQDDSKPEQQQKSPPQNSTQENNSAASSTQKVATAVVDSTAESAAAPEAPPQQDSVTTSSAATTTPPKAEAPQKTAVSSRGAKRKPRELKDLKGNATAAQDSASKSKRNRVQVQPYQIPLPEIAMIVKTLSKPVPKSTDDKLIVFYK